MDLKPNLPTGIPRLNSIREVLAEFRRGWQPLIGYELIFKTLVFSLAAPLATWLLSLLISASGARSVTNLDIIPFLLSQLGGITVIIAGGLFMTAQMAEEAGLVIIAAHGRARRRISAWRAAIRVAVQLPTLISAALAEFLVLLGWTVPVLAAGGLAYLVLQANHDINYYFKAWPPVFIVTVSALGLLGAALLVWLFRYLVLWTFVAPVCLFERLTFFQALQRSALLVRGSFWRILLILAGWLAASAAAAGLLVGGLSVPALLLLNTNASGAGVGKVGLALMSLVGAATLAGAAFISLIILPLIGIVVVHLYAEAYRRKGWPLPARCQCAPAPGQDAEQRRHLRPAVGVSLAAAAWVAGAIALGVILGRAARAVDRVHVIAHRGDSAHAPENTLSSLRRAIGLQAEIAEIDVQETKDGVIMVLHDNDLMRVAGVPQGLWQLTFAEARRLDVGSWFAPEFKGEKIPTLEEVIELTRGKIKMIIELKYNGHDQRLAERTAALIRQHGFESQCVVSSLNYEGLRQVKALDDQLHTVYILFTRIGDVAGLNADAFALQAAQVTPGFIKDVHAGNKPVYVWTVNKPADQEYFIELGADYLYTDDPAQLMALLQRRAAMSPAEKIIRKFKHLLDIAAN